MFAAMKRRPIHQRIGEAVRKRREAGNYNQEEFADHIKMHRAYYGEFERGKKDFRISTLERICEGLEISMADVVRDAENL
jgi:transcriptional regulator with XRE-family HTH domain